MEVSTPTRKDHTFDLYSPVYHHDSGVCLDFWYHMYGAHIGELIVFSVDENKQNPALIWSLQGSYAAFIVEIDV